MDSQAIRPGDSMENFRMDVGDVNKDIKTTIKMEQGLSFMAVIGLCIIGIWMNSGLWVLGAVTMGSIYLLVRGRKKGWKWPKRP